MDRQELLKSKGYWLGKIQMDLYNQITTYIRENKLSRTQLAEQLGVSKGYITQLMSGDFDHRISKLIELSLAIGKVPILNYVDTDDYIRLDENNLADGLYRNIRRRKSLVFQKSKRINKSKLITSKSL